MRIEDYALIGDCQTAALVSREGSIDWLCWPRFDSDACFAALLGNSDHGRWLIQPDAPARISRRYRPDTLILETRFTTDTGSVVLLDFMPPRGQHCTVARLIVGETGRVRMRTELVVRFGYGAIVPWVTRPGEPTGKQIWKAVAGPDMVVLRSPVALHGQDLRSVAQFDVSAGETIPFTLSYSPSHLPVPHCIAAVDALEQTRRYWSDWTANCEYAGVRREAVVRSLITLRALIYEPTGGIVAAPTTSLPEKPGGPRNWDYRYCWLRDATLTLLAFMNAGYSAQAGAWRDWLVRALAGSPSQMQIMYGVAGERRLTEWQVPWLPGYEASSPVRIGNAAYSQLQLDVYGEVMDALHQARLAGLQRNEPAWALQLALLAHLETIWREPDYGIWEVRSAPRFFTYSRVMAWVAFDRAVKGVEQLGLSGPVARWRALRDEIHADVCARGFDAARNTFVQSYGTSTLDASLLLLPAVGFLPVSDPRIQGTIAAIEKSLLRDGFVLRYDTVESEDGLPAGEGAFLACSFWLADAYAMSGRLDEANALFDRLVALSNDLGLLAEEYDPATRRLVGNFPQAFSHVALLGTACNLAHRVKPAEQRSGQRLPADG